MSPRSRTTTRRPVRALLAVSKRIAAAAAPIRGRALFQHHQNAWSRMSPLERGLAADRDDPNFDYAAN